MNVNAMIRHARHQMHPMFLCIMPVTWNKHCGSVFRNAMRKSARHSRQILDMLAAVVPNSAAVAMQKGRV
eukprot:4151299-Pyramimonas_sp.AAC.1